MQGFFCCEEPSFATKLVVHMPMDAFGTPLLTLVQRQPQLQQTVSTSARQSSDTFNWLMQLVAERNSSAARSASCGHKTKRFTGTHSCCFQ
ncbi:hypothetical protein IscW_ISCW001002 [Ixodes scapularis]|uniref:Uncharacterized protein n=1 Tax=Ixodes scapularis TaxID=6945 RepID=B7P6N9_IXOSC|nr:hypothetical protein IscW_ISCW001002 [Ixodes scapularis]|eukprot:XP_002409047.1 hypothetical protein IscW_ISCW001002 [Ixodes scapularis]